MIIGICGFIGSGKDTVADYLVNFHGFRRDSFAATLKDAVSAVFGWDRELLEGRTKEAREWREEIDQWWAERLDMPNLTPRLILQLWGTEVGRRSFHTDIWIASLENKLRKSNGNVVITDCRFPNEVQAIKNAGGIVIRVKRGPNPSWYNDACDMNAGEKCSNYAAATARINELGIHASETAWVGSKFDYVIENDGTIDDLCIAVKDRVLNLPAATEHPLCEEFVDSLHKWS